MSAPLMRLLTAVDPPPASFHRDIENRYHLESIARSVGELREFHEASLRLQAGHAETIVRGFIETAHQQRETDSTMAGLAQDMGAMLNGISALAGTAAGGTEALCGLTDTAREGLDRLSEQMMQQQRTLEEIAGRLRGRYRADALELCKEADKWLGAGMRSTGRDRDESFHDAARLLGHCIENPIGMQDYVAWFQMAWLKWKHAGNVSEAEDAFYRAARLSSEERDSYRLLSLRHLAYMHYLQGRHEDAYAAIQRAVDLSADHGTLFDAARYAAKSGREQEAIALLERCIRERPTTIVTMFAEEDFR